MKNRPKFRAGIFGKDNSDSDEPNEAPMTSIQLINKAIASQQEASKKQAEEARQKIMAEDPSSLLYDAHYDQIQREREALKEKSREKGKTRYISAIARASESRKIEQNIYKDKIRELKSQREGVSEKNTLSFVTDGYQAEKEMMEKRKKELEKEDEANSKKDGMSFQAFRARIFEERETEEPEKELLYQNNSLNSLGLGANKEEKETPQDSEEEDVEEHSRHLVEYSRDEEIVARQKEGQEKKGIEREGELKEETKDKGKVDENQRKNRQREVSRSRSREKEEKMKSNSVEEEKKEELSKEEKLRRARERLMQRKKEG